MRLIKKERKIFIYLFTSDASEGGRTLLLQEVQRSPPPGALILFQDQPELFIHFFVSFPS